MRRHRKVSKQKRRDTWYLVYRPPGQTKQVWESVGADEDTAEVRRLEKMAELADSEYVEPSRDSFESVAEEWWSSVAVVKFAESTQLDYRSILNAHLIPAFGKTAISKVRFREIQGFVRQKQLDGLSGKRIRNLLIVLSDVFGYACNAELCRTNPVDKVERPPIERKEVDCLEVDELWRLLAAVEEDQPFYYPLVLTALFTGMRLGELRALEWSTVDFDNNEIRVRNSQARKGVKGPKSPAGWRTIPMSSVVRDVLLARYDAKILDCELVFPSHRLTPFDPSNVRTRVLKAGLEKAKLRHVTWHSLRHSAASLMALSHSDEKEVQTILGHSSIQVTKDLYTHLFRGAKSDAIDRMTELMISSKPDEAEESKAVYGAALEVKNASRTGVVADAA